MSELSKSSTDVIEIEIANQRRRTAVRAVRRTDRQLLWQLLFDSAEEALQFAINCRASEQPVTAHKACELAG
ncbi:hypothetical protein [Microbulbifer thermotolerans]|uniref:Uncharacterized protein n=1 Tax=Microbulbifer thermotolerans TaxID=252514 RepID=A0A143HKD0_MICTH|nr:hypothetical protein [Microbulbifer thermotolerans]AMX02185.1 hypothetical protein A3224_05950 [Microbulbifer thermotolerans]MCX2778844.1 hypothetical protein [Microbulbifer thermotolerans]MCX2781884.1 hypothetical protein [Microbulbifer thermotolerans]MCX2793730.1 hypothetical protein [Microbulbifer thermotolerans]MCX2800914.1 hypothetical protein [Microbulbifer thermotolerans]